MRFRVMVYILRQARKKIFSAEAAALRQGQKVSIQEAFSATGSLAGALKVCGVFGG